MLSPSSRITRGHSCLFCQQRKVRCDGQQPCSTCVRNGQDCKRRILSSRLQGRRPRVSGDAHQLARRLELCERAIKAHGISLEEEEGGAERDKRPSRCSPDNASRSTPSENQPAKKRAAVPQYVENPLWEGLAKDLDDYSTVADESEEEVPQSMGGGMLLFCSSHSGSLRSLHPETSHIFQLWQVFLNNVNPIVKLLHAPTTQQVILKTVFDLDHISRPTEALLFSIYLCAVASLSDEDSHRVLGASRSDLVARFSRAAEQALVNAEFLRSTYVETLQALTLYLLATRQQYDVQTRWVLTGIASRVARAMGLHRECSLAAILAFEREMRRRLWWQILIMDSRAAQLCGVTVDAHSYVFWDFWDTERPRNLSDSDLSLFMKELPTDRTGATEMLFCQIRFEIGDCMRKLTAIEHQFRDASMDQRIAEEERVVDVLENQLEDRYLKECDPSIPFHQMCLYLARSSVCQMRLAIRHPRRCANLSPSEKDSLFSLGLEVLTYDNLTYASQDLQPYLWHVGMSFPFEAFILVVTELLTRREGELVDQAWAKVDQMYHDHPDLITASKTNTLFFALGTLTLRAWEMRITRTQRNPTLPQPNEPQSITQLRALRGNSSAPSLTRVPGFPLVHAPVAGSLVTAESETSIVPGADDLDPSAMDLSQIDWEGWQNLIDGQVDYLQF